MQNAAFVPAWRCRRATARAAIGKSWRGREKRRSLLGEPWFLADELQVVCPLGTGREAACPCLPAAGSLELASLESHRAQAVAGASPRGGLASPVPFPGCLCHWGLQQCFNLALLLCRGDTWDKVPGKRQVGQDRNSISW